MTSGAVFDIKHFSLHDGPGIRTTIFLKGCGLRCWWCHNPESQRPGPELMLRPELCIGCGGCVDACPEGAITMVDGQPVTDRARCTRCGTCTTVCYADAREIIGRTMTVAEVMERITGDTPFFDQSGGGVTFSGGEPLLQGDFLLALLRACKALDLDTTVDTCGHAPTATLEQVRPYTDRFLYDLKLMDSERHRQHTGVPNALILHNLRVLAGHNHPIILRIPIIPNINDDADNIRQIGALASTLPAVERVDILAYHHIGTDKYARLGRQSPMPPTEVPSDEQMAAIQQMLEQYGLAVTIGG